MKTSREFLWASLLTFAVGVVCLMLLTGCGMFGVGKISLPGMSVRGVKDAGTPAILATSTAGEAIALPEGSKVVKTEYSAVPATPDNPAQPAKTVTEIIPAGPSEYKKTESKAEASTGTIDTSVANHQIDVEERRWLLWAAIGCGIGGIVLKSMLPAWPGISNGLLIAAPCAFAAWKFSEVPAWIWAVVIGIVAAMAMGYKRADMDKNKDGIPDILQK